jgi:spoIIIJ-associated protein
MTSGKHDFYGKEVTDAIQQACEKLQVPQEQLDIEVVETGSTGIFGLIRKKAHIRAHIKTVEPPAPPKKNDISKPVEKAQPAEKVEVFPVTPEPERIEKGASPEPTAAPVSDDEGESIPFSSAEAIVNPDIADIADIATEGHDEISEDEDDQLEPSEEEESGEELPEAALDLIKDELVRLLDLMGYPSSVEVSAKGASVFCHVGETYEDILTGQDGKTVDSIQYLLRKIIARKVPNRLRLTVDIGNYREKRLAELKIRALELAEKVKTDGKTQVIAALSPSERRVIHMSLQDDKEIRSRSVGDGLFKKILIYKPGKAGKGGGRKRSNSRGRKGPNNRKKSE